MKQLFHIINNSHEDPQKVLALRLGEQHACFAITDLTGNHLFELAYCITEDPVDTGWNENSMAEFFSAYPLLSSSLALVRVAFDYPQSVLTPSLFSKPEESEMFLAASHGILSGSRIFNAIIPEWELNNSYSVPDDIYRQVNQKFPGATYRHPYSLGLKQLNATGKEGHILVDFRSNDFTLLAAKESTLLLAQHFSYTTPADIVYYLLKTCHQFSLLQGEVNLHLSGLIDKDSAVYKELYQYFIHIEFREASWNTGSDYPAHFFTSLNDLAQCAS